ncbi:MAG TPA: hypothetical protein VI583_16055 [Cyclobacteriaceae bacterium]|nr:hypothetical protein [Cyclobacteriaceae bacterium]
MKYIFIIALLLGPVMVVRAQCAMCRATVENSISEGHESFAASLNAGILYLFVMPYLAAAVLVWLWLRESRKNERKNKIRIRHIS